MKNPRESTNSLGSMMTTPGSVVGSNEKGMLGLVSQQPEQILPVGAALHRLAEPLEIGGADVTHAVGDLLGAADHLSLPLLHRLHEAGRLNQRFVGPGVEPGDA